MSTPLSPAERYDRLSILFHWGTVLLMIAAFATIEGRVLLERGTPARLAIKEWHYVIGICLLFLTLARLAHRQARHAPGPVQPPVAGWQTTLSTAMHWLLLGALVVQPILGLVTVGALGDPVVVLGYALPPVTGLNEPFGEWLEGVHGLVGDALYVLIAGHAAAALAHHYLRRDSTLVRMLPGADPEASPALRR